jgi:hypothetical protein
MDTIGPVSPTAFEKDSKYILCVIDDYSRYAHVFLMCVKSETHKNLKKVLQIIQSQYPNRGQFKTIRCDGAKEFLCKNVDKLLDEYGN